MKIESFKPIIDSECKIIILGSMPGKESLLRQEYYAHKRNNFWKIIGDVIGFDLYNSDYSVKKKMLLKHNIALWDVLKSCKRKSSMDSDICDEKLNDFDNLFKEYPNLKAVFFNGQKAGQYKRKFGKYCSCIFILPSTSPAHASKSYNEKLKIWKEEIEKELK